MKLSIVIPCYNEEKNIPLVLEKLNSVIKRTDVEVILVDNGSTDNSDLVFATLLPKYPFAKKVKVEKNQGYGFGILSGLREAKGEYIGWTHADMQTDPYDSIKALELIDPEKHHETGNFVLSTLLAPSLATLPEMFVHFIERLGWWGDRKSVV